MTDERDRPPAELLESLNFNDCIPQVIHYELKWDFMPRSPKTPPPVASLNKK